MVDWTSNSNEKYRWREKLENISQSRAWEQLSVSFLDDRLKKFTFIVNNYTSKLLHNWRVDHDAKDWVSTSLEDIKDPELKTFYTLRKFVKNDQWLEKFIQKVTDDVAEWKSTHKTVDDNVHLLTEWAQSDTPVSEVLDEDGKATRFIATFLNSFFDFSLKKLEPAIEDWLLEKEEDDIVDELAKHEDFKSWSRKGDYEKPEPRYAH